MDNKRHIVIIVPGLGDGKRLTRVIEYILVKLYSRQDFQVVFHRMDWYNNEESFDKKSERLLVKIDVLINQGYAVSLIGTSAGASAVFNVFSVRKEKIIAVINVSGRLKKGENVSPSLDWAARNSRAFKESVLLAENNITNLTENDKQKILIMQPNYDEIVPLSTMTLEGVEIKKVFGFEHILNIFLSLIVYFGYIKKFILSRV